MEQNNMLKIDLILTVSKTDKQNQFTGEVTFTNKEIQNEIKVRYLCINPKDHDRLNIQFNHEGEDFHLVGELTPETFRSLANPKHKVLSSLTPYYLISEIAEEMLDTTKKIKSSTEVPQSSFDLIFPKS